jgi:hypothetical protein
MSYLQLDFFYGFFSNIFNIVMVILFVLVGIVIGLILKPKAKDQVMKLIPRDMRFVDFDVRRENAFSVECDPKKGFPPQRYIKYKPGWTGKVGKFLKRSVTRHLGLEGTAYTCKVEDGQTIQIPTKEGNPEPATIDNAVLLGSLTDCLKGLWGTEFYEQVPEARREEIEESQVNVIVGLEEIKTPVGFKEITEEAIKQEEDRLAAETWWKGKKQAEKGAWLQYIWLLLAGAGIMAIASKFLGWW